MLVSSKNAKKLAGPDYLAASKLGRSLLSVDGGFGVCPEA
jgi:hypothetical protein